MSLQATTRRSLTRDQRDRSVIKVLAGILVLNLLVAILKLVFGYFAGAVSMLADGLHSLMDSASNVVGLVGISIARRDPDSNHPYGHRKFEALAALGISMFLFISAWEVLREVIQRWGRSHEVQPGIETFVVMGATLLINVGVTRYESRRARELKSGILLADSRHTLSDVFVTVGVLASLVAASLEIYFLDLVTAVAITGVIGYTAYRIVAGALGVLADAAAIDPKAVAGEALAIEGVTHAHRVRSRGGADDIHVDLHIHVPPDLSTRVAHEIAHEVADRIRERFEGVTDVVVHVEPEGHQDEPEEPAPSLNLRK
jgi:cation diffusion facilitator family transporter